MEIVPHFKRMKRQEVPGTIRFVTFSCQHRLPLLGNPRIRNEFSAALARSRVRHRFELFAWVAMPEHVHLLVRPYPSVPLDRALLSPKLSIARVVINRWIRMDAAILARMDDGHGSPRFWQKGGGFDRNVRGMTEFCRNVKYIHNNPLSRGLVTSPEDWGWSSLRWWMGEREGQAVECDPPPGRSDWSKWKGYV